MNSWWVASGQGFANHATHASCVVCMAVGSVLSRLVGFLLTGHSVSAKPVILLDLSPAMPDASGLRPCCTHLREDDTPAFFMAHLVSSVMYHADRDKEKCDLHDGRRQGLVQWEGQNQPEIKLHDATVASCRIKS